MNTMWAALAIAMCLGCGLAVEPEPEATIHPIPYWAPANVLLVTEDTTRAILVEKVYIQQDLLGEITVLLDMGDSSRVILSPIDWCPEPDHTGRFETWEDSTKGGE